MQTGQIWPPAFPDRQECLPDVPCKIVVTPVIPEAA